jgi:hypothetical protein
VLEIAAMLKGHQPTRTRRRPMKRWSRSRVIVTFRETARQRSTSVAVDRGDAGV